MTFFAGGIAFGQESYANPVSLYRNNLIEPLFLATNIEGLTSDGQNLYAVEDKKTGGRLLKYDSSSGNLTALRDNLEEAEGIVVCPDGSLFYTEKERGWIKKYHPGSKENDKTVATALR